MTTVTASTVVKCNKCVCFISDIKKIVNGKINKQEVWWIKANNNKNWDKVTNGLFVRANDQQGILMLTIPQDIKSWGINTVCKLHYSFFVAFATEILQNVVIIANLQGYHTFPRSFGISLTKKILLKKKPLDVESQKFFYLKQALVC